VQKVCGQPDVASCIEEVVAERVIWLAFGPADCQPPRFSWEKQALGGYELFPFAGAVGR
jgi:hypothetical protein